MSEITGTPLVLLHGAGQAPMSWERVVVPLYGSRPLLTPWVPGLRPTETAPVSLEDAAAALDQQLMLEGMETVDVCGLGYGALVATRLAGDHPHRVRRLVLIGGLVRPPRVALRAQAAALRMTPAARLADAGVSKSRLLEALERMRSIDLTGAVARIEAPTLVLAGERDRAGAAGARDLARGIRGAQLGVVPGAGANANEDAPEALVGILREHLDES